MKLLRRLSYSARDLAARWSLRFLRRSCGVEAMEFLPRVSSPLSYVEPASGVAALVRVRCDEHIGSFSVFHHAWQAEELRFVERASEGVGPFTLIDAGAHVGLFSRQCLARLKQCTVVHAYEPDPFNFELLEHNLRPFRGVTCRNVALSDSDGRVELLLDPTNTGNCSFVSAAMPAVHGREWVEAVDAAKEHLSWLHPEQPIFYKSDLQGFDERVALAFGAAFWERVFAGILEVWRIEKPSIDQSKLAAILDRYPRKTFLRAPRRNLTTSQVLEYLRGRDGQGEDLGFSR